MIFASTAVCELVQPRLIIDRCGLADVPEPKTYSVVAHCESRTKAAW